MAKNKLKEPSTVIAGTIAAFRYGSDGAYDIAKTIIRDLADAGYSIIRNTDR